MHPRGSQVVVLIQSALLCVACAAESLPGDAAGTADAAASGGPTIATVEVRQGWGEFGIPCEPSLNGCTFTYRFEDGALYVQDDWEDTRVELTTSELAALNAVLQNPAFVDQVLVRQMDPSSVAGVGDQMYFKDADGEYWLDSKGEQLRCSVSGCVAPTTLPCELADLMGSLIRSKVVCPPGERDVDLLTERSAVRFFCITCSSCQIGDAG